MGTGRQPTWSVIVAVMGLLVVSVVIALGRQGHGDGPPASGQRVVGTLQTVGGPAPGLPRNVPGSVVFQGSKRAPITAVVDENGTFAARVPPGAYTVIGFSPYYTGPCDGVTVSTPTAVPVHVYCQEA